MKVPTLLRPRRGFTLIELLVVITIIAVLAAAGFAVGTRALNRARGVSAQSTAVSLDQAVNLFFSEYGTFPTSEREVTTGSGSSRFLNALTGQDQEANPRGIRFLSAPEGTRDGEEGGRNGLVYAPGGDVRGLFDPWGNPYTVVLDTEFQERLTFTTPDGRSVTLNGRRAAVYSPGVQPGEDIRTSDLITSW